jgi:hypothetical protein
LAGIKSAILVQIVSRLQAKARPISFASGIQP